MTRFHYQTDLAQNFNRITNSRAYCQHFTRQSFSSKEERIMKLIERRHRLSGRGNTFILAAVLSLLVASSAVAAAFSLNIDQGGKEKSSNKSLNEKIIGEWDMSLDRGKGYAEGDATGPALIVEANR